jgi:hypothetical protein
VTAGDDHLLRNVTREVLAELLPGLLEEALTAPAPANGNGHHAATEAEPATVPQVPAPPVAAVHRPPGWRPPEGAPAAEADQVQPSPKTPPPDDGAVERVELRSDAELDAFVRSLARRLENPRDRMAILSGRLRFVLAATAPAASAPASWRAKTEHGKERGRDSATHGPTEATPAGEGLQPPVMRIEKGAATERHVREAAEKGARLILSPRAVLTPMARDRARSLGVEIEKERRC